MKGQLLGASELTSDVVVQADVCIVGSGAGGAVLAAGLAERGLYVVVLEEGSAYTSKDFRRLDEAWSLPHLYQERGTRATADLAITVLQGRSVGGGTTVNWTTCFRTPPRILEHWQRAHGLALTEQELAPHFEAIEQRLGIARWDSLPPNPNNDTLMRGATALGWQVDRTSRNVRGCANSGYCGFGCPFDAKQAMHLTFIPDALSRGATVLSDTRALRLEVQGDRVVAVHAQRMDPERDRELPIRVRIEAERVVLSAGALGSPALLMRSGLGGPVVGRRTFLHPVVGVVGRYPERVDGWYGAPQSVASHEHVDRGAGEVGFFLEAAPIHPMLSGASLPGFGAGKQELIAELSHKSSLIAICVDGILPGDEGGTVTVRDDGRIRLDYPISEALARAFRDAHGLLGKVHFAAGAAGIATLHSEPVILEEASQLSTLGDLRYGAHEHAIFSAHQMGGCTMGPDPERSVVDEKLRHHGMANLWVVDGSVLPTGLGVNPSETIYGLAHWATQHVAG
jgi:choline dehydrogenase-like flavoprotein